MKVLKEKFLLDYKNTTEHSEIHLKDFFLSNEDLVHKVETFAESFGMKK